MTPVDSSVRDEHFAQWIADSTDYWVEIIACQMAAELWSAPDDKMIAKLGNDLWLYARFYNMKGGDVIGINGELEATYTPPPDGYVITDWGGQIVARINVPIKSFILDVAEEVGISEERIQRYYNKGKGTRTHITKIVKGFNTVYVRQSSSGDKSERNPPNPNRKMCEKHRSPRCLKTIVAIYYDVLVGMSRVSKKHEVCQYHAEEAEAFGSKVQWYQSNSNPRGWPCPICGRGQILIRGTICRACSRAERNPPIRGGYDFGRIVMCENCGRDVMKEDWDNHFYYHSSKWRV